MFSKASKTQGRDQKNDGSGRSVPSIISSDLTITGDLLSSGEIQIDGVVKGDIRCSALIIGTNGSVVGEIDAESIRLHGKIEGQVRAKTVFLASTAHMVGDITHESLAIEPGAFMEGHCRRMAEGGTQVKKDVLSEIKADSKKPALSFADASRSGVPEKVEAVAG